MIDGGLNGLDLFSGIGGISKALDGYVRPMAYCEIDPYCRGVLVSRMRSGDIPTAPVWDDVKTLRGHMLPPIDIVYGGFPCQDISVAGRGAGLGGERSGLFFEIVRLAEEIKPSFIFLENVPAIRRRGLDRVVEELTALRYDCRWGMLSAADVGANHKRERWFLLAHSESGIRQRTTQVETRYPSFSSEDVADPKGQQDGRVRESGLQPNIGAGGSLADSASTGWPTEGMADTGEAESRRPSAGIDGLRWWTIEPDVGRVAHGVPKRVHRLRALGNAVVPQQAREAFERLMGLK